MTVEDARSKTASYMLEIIAHLHEAMEGPLMTSEDQLAHDIRGVEHLQLNFQSVINSRQTMHERLEEMKVEVEHAEVEAETAVESEKASNEAQIEALDDEIFNDPLKLVVSDLEADIMKAHAENGDLEGQAESSLEQAELFEARRLEAITEHDVSLTGLREAAFDKSEVAQKGFAEEQEARNAAHEEEMKEVEVQLKEEEKTVRELEAQIQELKAQKLRALRLLRPVEEVRAEAILRMQSLARGAVVRRTIQIEGAQSAAALKIQLHWRGAIARRLAAPVIAVANFDGEEGLNPEGGEGSLASASPVPLRPSTAQARAEAASIKADADEAALAAAEAETARLKEERRGGSSGAETARLKAEEDAAAAAAAEAARIKSEEEAAAKAAKEGRRSSGRGGENRGGRGRKPKAMSLFFVGLYEATFPAEEVLLAAVMNWLR